MDFYDYEAGAGAVGVRTTLTVDRETGLPLRASVGISFQDPGRAGAGAAGTPSATPLQLATLRWEFYDFCAPVCAFRPIVITQIGPS